MFIQPPNSCKIYSKLKIYSLILVIHVTKVYNKEIYCKFRGKNQTQLTKKNLQFFPCHLVIILNNFQVDWIEIGNFLPMSNCRICLIFFAQDFSYDLSKDLDFILDMIHMHANSCHNDITDFVTICIISMIP